MVEPQKVDQPDSTVSFRLCTVVYSFPSHFPEEGKINYILLFSRRPGMGGGSPPQSTLVRPQTHRSIGSELVFALCCRQQSAREEVTWKRRGWGWIFLPHNSARKKHVNKDGGGNKGSFSFKILVLTNFFFFFKDCQYFRKRKIVTVLKYN